MAYEAGGSGWTGGNDGGGELTEHDSGGSYALDITLHGIQKAAPSLRSQKPAIRKTTHRSYKTTFIPKLTSGDRSRVCGNLALKP